MLSPLGESLSPKGEASPIRFEEAVMKQALLNVVTDLKLMVLIIVLSQVIAIAKALA